MVETYVLDLPCGMTERGFWLYVWRVGVGVDEFVHYVGRTGDSASPYASSAYQRMGQHLGEARTTNALLQHLSRRWPGREIQSFVSFRMISHGPVFPEVGGDFQYRVSPGYETAFELHKPLRDRAAALEAKLASALTEGGYDVLNRVPPGPALIDTDWLPVKAAFARHFPNIAELT
jgi:hypothetical protein